MTTNESPAPRANPGSRLIQGALAAFPSVLEGILLRGKRVGKDIVALNPRRADALKTGHAAAPTASGEVA